MGQRVVVPEGHPVGFTSMERELPEPLRLEECLLELTLVATVPVRVEALHPVDGEGPRPVVTLPVHLCNRR